jgi:hypothetical protein
LVKNIRFWIIIVHLLSCFSFPIFSLLNLLNALDHHGFPSLYLSTNPVVIKEALSVGGMEKQGSCIDAVTLIGKVIVFGQLFPGIIICNR